MQIQLAVMVSVVALSACTTPDTGPRDAASGAVNPMPPSDARGIPLSATPPTVPDNPDDAMPPGPVNPR
ncbi:MAG: hypothetical protein EON94_11840 [Caulobacteraceae bacterium]|nr:MAG: hypothetical protein EON94_11840 [Caulobacteraceae bacterium]